MKSYVENSPEAIARILSMFILSDGDLHDLELDRIEELDVFELLGLSRKHFLDVLKVYCNDISDEAESDGAIHLVDRPRFEAMLDDVSDRHKRLLTCTLALDLSKADSVIRPTEMALLQHMMKTWDLSLDSIENEFVRP